MSNDKHAYTGSARHRNAFSFDSGDSLPHEQDQFWMVGLNL
jgi:hypothetical protein